LCIDFDYPTSSGDGTYGLGGGCSVLSWVVAIHFFSSWLKQAPSLWTSLEYATKAYTTVGWTEKALMWWHPCQMPK
jgi:hypothetical protein